MRALIVDDSRFVRGFLRGLLEAKRNRVRRGRRRKSRTRQTPGDLPFDIALLDWNMPVMDGYEMLTAMRAQGYAGTKVLMVTTEAENDFILRALDAGADEYLMKPFDDEALNEKLAMLGLVEA